ncbi:hypothetical protein PHSC3_001275 [Chlamydiales bacterium STE3]|nr:hypothetical protein PHSC3_001275 [Chlamydiales bacterium STE3]
MSFISGINLNPNNSFFENSSGNKCDTALEVDRSNCGQKCIKSPWNTLYQLFRAQGLLDEDALTSDLLKNFAWEALPLEKVQIIENFWNQEEVLFSKKLNCKLVFKRRDFIDWLLTNNQIELNSLEMMGSAVLKFCGLDYFLHHTAFLLKKTEEELKKDLRDDGIALLRGEIETANDVDLRVKVAKNGLEYLQNIAISIRNFFKKKIKEQPLVYQVGLMALQKKYPKKYLSGAAHADLLDQIVLKYFSKPICSFDGWTECHLYKLGNLDITIYETMKRDARFTKRSLALPMRPFYIQGNQPVIPNTWAPPLENGQILIDLMTNYLRPKNFLLIESTDWLHAIPLLSRGARSNNQIYTLLIESWLKGHKPLKKVIHYSIKHLPKTATAACVYFWNVFYTIEQSIAGDSIDKKALSQALFSAFPKQNESIIFTTILESLKEQELTLQECHFALYCAAFFSRSMHLEEGFRVTLAHKGFLLSFHLLPLSYPSNLFEALLNESNPKLKALLFNIFSTFLKEKAFNEHLDTSFQKWQGDFLHNSCPYLQKIGCLFTLALNDIAPPFKAILLLNSFWIWCLEGAEKDFFLSRLETILQLSKQKLIAFENEVGTERNDYVFFLYDHKLISLHEAWKELKRLEKKEQLPILFKALIRSNDHQALADPQARQFIPDIAEDKKLVEEVLGQAELKNALQNHSNYYLIVSSAFKEKENLLQRLELWGNYFFSRQLSHEARLTGFSMALQLLDQLTEMPEKIHDILEILGEELVPPEYSEQIKEKVTKFYAEHSEFSYPTSWKNLLSSEDKAFIKVATFMRKIEEAKWQESEELAIFLLEDPRIANHKDFQEALKKLLHALLSREQLSGVEKILKKPYFRKYLKEDLGYFLTLKLEGQLLSLNESKQEKASIQHTVFALITEIIGCIDFEHPSSVLLFSTTYLTILNHYWLPESSFHSKQRGLISPHLLKMLLALWQNNQKEKAFQLLLSAHACKISFGAKNESVHLISEMISYGFQQSGVLQFCAKKALPLFSCYLEGSCWQTILIQLLRQKQQDELLWIFSLLDGKAWEKLSSLEEVSQALYFLLGYAESKFFVRIYSFTQHFCEPFWQAFWKECILHCNHQGDQELFLRFHLNQMNESVDPIALDYAQELVKKEVLSEIETKFAFALVGKGYLSFATCFHNLLKNEEAIEKLGLTELSINLLLQQLETISLTEICQSLSKLIQLKSCCINLLLKTIASQQFVSIIERQALKLDEKHNFVKLYTTFLGEIAQKRESKALSLKVLSLVIKFRNAALPMVTEHLDRPGWKELKFLHCFLESSEQLCLQEAALLCMNNANLQKHSKDLVEKTEELCCYFVKKLRVKRTKWLTNKKEFVEKLLNETENPSSSILLECVLLLYNEETRPSYFLTMRLIYRIYQQRGNWNEAFLEQFKENQEQLIEVLKKSSCSTSTYIEGAILAILTHEKLMPFLNPQKFGLTLAQLIISKLKQMSSTLDSSCLIEALFLFQKNVHLYHGNLNQFEEAYYASLQIYLLLLEKNQGFEVPFLDHIKNIHSALSEKFSLKKDEALICLLLLRSCERIFESAARLLADTDAEKVSIGSLYTLFEEIASFLFKFCAEEYKIELLVKTYLFEINHGSLFLKKGGGILIEKDRPISLQPYIFIVDPASAWITNHLSAMTQQPLKYSSDEWKNLNGTVKNSVVLRVCDSLLKATISSVTIEKVREYLRKYQSYVVEIDALNGIYRSLLEHSLNLPFTSKFEGCFWQKIYLNYLHHRQLSTTFLNSYLSDGQKHFSNFHQGKSDFKTLFHRYYSIRDRESVESRLKCYQTIVHQTFIVLSSEWKQWHLDIDSFISALKNLILMLNSEQQLRNAAYPLNPERKGVSFLRIYHFIAKISFANLEERHKNSLRLLSNECLINAHDLVFYTDAQLKTLYSLPLPEKPLPEKESSYYDLVEFHENFSYLDFEKRNVLNSAVKSLLEDDLESFKSCNLQWDQPLLPHFSVLHLACWHQADKIVLWLCENAPGMLTDTSYQHTFFEIACAKGRIDLVKKFFAACKNHLSNETLANMLSVALNDVSEEQYMALYNLYEKNIDPKQLFNICEIILAHGLTLFHLPLALGKLSFFQKIWEQGHCPNLQDREGNTLLHYIASAYAHQKIVSPKTMIEIAKKLIEAKADPLIQNNKKVTPQKIACKSGMCFLLNILVTEKMQVFPLLFFCASEGLTESFVALSEIYTFKFAAKEETLAMLYNSYNTQGLTPLLIACQKKHHEIVHHILKHGANPLLRDSLNRNALETALDHNQITNAQMVLSIISCPLFLKHDDALINPLERGPNALHYCASNKQKKMALELLRFGYPLNIKDEKGDTPLHRAIRNNNRVISLCFLRHIDKHQKFYGVINMENDSGETPLDIALENRYTELATCLLKMGAKKGKKKIPLETTVKNAHGARSKKKGGK